MRKIALNSSTIKSTKFFTQDVKTLKLKKSFWFNKFVEFCNRTDLHGYKYIVMKEFSKFERIGWAVAVLLSTVVAAYFVVTAYNWYARNPIGTVSKDSSFKPISYALMIGEGLLCKAYLLGLLQHADQTVACYVTRVTERVLRLLIPNFINEDLKLKISRKLSLVAYNRLNAIQITIFLFYNKVFIMNFITYLRVSRLQKHGVNFKIRNYIRTIYKMYSIRCFNVSRTPSRMSEYPGFWEDKTELLVIESTQGAIWDVPFPAVTICDVNIVSKKAAREFSNNLTLPVNVTANFVFKTLRYIPLLQSAFKATTEEKAQLLQLQHVLDLNNISVAYLFKLLSPAISCSRLLQKCMWKNTIYHCDELFTQIFTPLSVCCAFNYYAVDDKKQETDAQQVPTPRRVASCGYKTALMVAMYSDTNDYYSATVGSKGVLVIIDSADNIPNIDSPIRMVNPSTEVLIALSPEITYTTSGIKAFHPEARQCYYNDEIRIGNFRRYSFHNCMAYQKIVLIKSACECIPVLFPIEDGYRQCNFRDMDCIEKVMVQKEYNNSKEIRSDQNLKCLPECEHYDYPFEVALGKLADDVYASGLPFYDDITLENRSFLNVFFNDLVSTKYRRDVYLNWQNLLSAFGGLLSLMIGFTLISGLDLILFFIIRIVYSSWSWFLNKQKTVDIINDQVYHKKDNWVYSKQDNIHLQNRSDNFDHRDRSRY